MKFICFYILVMLVQILPAQTNEFSSFYLYGNRSRLANSSMQPNGSNAGQADNMVFWFYPYKGTTLSLVDLKRRVPEWSTILPEEVRIIPPVFEPASDTIWGVSLLESDTPEKRPHLLVIVLVNNSESRVPTYYIDRNLNGDFSDDEPFRFYSSRQSVNIKLQSPGYRYNFRLINPYFQEDYVAPPSAGQQQNEDKLENGQVLVTKGTQPAEPATSAWERAEVHKANGWLMDFRLANNLAWIRYQYDVKNSPISYDYSVRANAKGVGLSIGYQWKGVRALAVMDYENYYYWSTIRTRTDAQLTTKEVNKDRLPKNQYSYGLEIGWQLPLNKTFNLVPYAQYLSYWYSADNQYVPNQFDDGIQYELINRHQWAMGLAIAANFSDYSQVYFRMGYAQLSFQPDGFFEAESASNLISRNQKCTIQIGWTWRPGKQ